jgi:hypothetical protein
MGLPCCGISYPIWGRAETYLSDLGHVQALGAKYIRIDYLYNHSSNALAEAVTTAALARGIAVDLILDGPRRYDDPGRVPTSQMRTWAQSVASKFAERVLVYEVLNEPDLNGWTPAQYAAHLREAYIGIKAGDPTSVVATGGFSKWECLDSTCYSPPNSGTAIGIREWVRQLYAAGAQGSFDTMSLHLYEGPAGQWGLGGGDWSSWDYTFGKSGDNIRAIMDANGDYNKPIWSSEDGAAYPHHSLDQQANLTRQKINAVRNQTYPLASVTHYTLRDDDVSGFGLLDPTGVPRPAYYGARDSA